MEEQNKICPSCGASNDPSYSFCHICGTALNAQTGAGTGNYPQNSQFGGQYGNGSAYGEYNGAAGNYGSTEPQTIAGCPTEAVRAFVGPGKLFDKLVKTELTQSKVSWVWPVVILALLFGSGGIMFASLWFFYRRMSKWGLLTALCGLVLYAVNCFVYLRAFQPVITVYFDMIKDIVNSVIPSPVNSPPITYSNSTYFANSGVVSFPSSSKYVIFVTKSPTYLPSPI